MKLQRLLNDFLSPPRRKPRDPDYARFRAFARKHQLAYRVTSDSYIEVEKSPAYPRGLTTAHYSWGETLERLEHCLANPEAVDSDGYYAE